MHHSIPKRLVVLTFDDAVSNHATLVAPLLKRHGFNATFFVCEFPPDFETNKEQYMDWEQIQALAKAGFEIGNHTLHHALVNQLGPEELSGEIEALESRCRQHGIPKPTSFAYPACGVSPTALPVLQQHGYTFARIGSSRAYDPAKDDPLLIPSFPCHGADASVFHNATEQACDGHIAVLMFHGVPEFTHPWVNTEPVLFKEYIEYLARNHFTVIAMRELSRYVKTVMA